jgi:MFS family permease
MARPARGSFYGWWIVGSSFVILFVTVGIGLYVPPVFLIPLQEHFGWSRAAIATGSAIAAIVSGIVSPLVGVWIDRYGSRTVMTAGALLMGGAFALFSLMDSLWELYAFNMLAAVGITCVAWIPNQTLISNWFERRRGLAMGIALTGIGFGGLLMAPCAALLIARLGWRLAFAALSAFILVVVVTAVLAVVRSRPGDMGLLPDGEITSAVRAGASAGREVGAGFDLPQALKTRAFWVLSVGNFLGVFASLSIVGHLVACLRDAGFESHVAAASLGLAVGVSVVGRVLVGFLADRLSKRNMASGASALCAVAPLLLLSVRSVGALPAFVITFGLGLGGVAVMIPLLVGECFGLLAFGKILGVIMISGTLGGAAGPVLTGRIFDVTGSYSLAFMLHAVVFLAAALAFYLLPRPELSAAHPRIGRATSA